MCPLPSSDALESAGTVVDCPAANDLRLTDRYHTAWQARMDKPGTARARRDRLARSLSISSEEITFEEAEDGLFAFIDGSRAGGWESKAAFLADLAGNESLESRFQHWNDLSPRDPNTSTGCTQIVPRNVSDVWGRRRTR